jgi:predicted ATP-grasp superfamily ATP-dependent carboligase
MKKIRIVVTGAGGPASIGFCRSLRDSDTNYEIIGVDCDRFHLNLAEVDYKYLIPPASDPDYIPVLNHVANNHQAHFLHSQPDAEIELLSEKRELLNVKTNFPKKEVVRTCMDKWESYKKWEKAGIKIPKTLFINNQEDLTRAFEELGDKIWVRNIKGAAGKGSLPTSNEEEACKWVDFCEGWGCFTAAELLTDRTVTWQSIWDNGKLLVAQTRERLYWEFGNRSPSGVTGLTGTGVTVEDEQINEIALATIKTIDNDPHGIFSVDMTYDFNGIPNPTEINIGRFFTTHYFFTRAGVNFPDIFIRTSLGKDVELPVKTINPLTPGLAWIRGIDSVPVLVSLELLELMERSLEEIRNESKSGS